jgi:hypothetical protein
MQNTGWRWSEAAAITASLLQPAALIELVEGDGSDNALKKATSSAASDEQIVREDQP